MKRLGLWTILIGSGGCVMAQSATTARPVPGVVRWVEDYSFLREPERRTDFFDPAKFAPLNRDGSIYATFGAEYRAEWEWIRNPEWDIRDNDASGYVLQRFMPYADVHFGKRLRFFTTLKFNYINSRKNGPRPVDEDKGDIHEAFLDGKIIDREGHSLTLRTGRQELNYGQGLLINNREGTNVRQSFDGATLYWRSKTLRVDAFAARPARTNRGWFDDSPEHRQTVWGLYTTIAGKVDLFWIGTDQKVRRWQRGAGRDRRNTLGARWADRKKGWIYDYEGAWQAGTFRESTPIRAWAIATETGYEFDARWKPHVALRTDLSSGDRGGDTLGNFLVPYPKGSYWGKLLLNGPFNFTDLHPVIDLRVRQNVVVSAGWIWFWRTSTRDGVYGIGGQLLRSGTRSKAAFIGQQGNLEATWTVNRNLRMSAAYSGFLAGQFLKEVPPDRNVNFVNIGATYRF